MKDWNLGLREGPGFVEFDMDDLEKACQCNVDAYADYPLYPAIFGSLAGPDMIYKNWFASIRAMDGAVRSTGSPSLFRPDIRGCRRSVT